MALLLQAQAAAAEEVSLKATHAAHENGVAGSESRDDVPVEMIKDSWAFKRAREVYASPK